MNDINSLKPKINKWTRIIDDCLVITNATDTEITALTTYLNNIHNNIKFSTETENQKQLNFLDLNIQRNNKNYHLPYIGNLHIRTQ